MMSVLSRLPTEHYSRDISAVAVSSRFILCGQVTGEVSARYHRNGVAVFSVTVSTTGISAVCCEELGEEENPVFYAGDNQGKLFTINKKGVVLATARVKGIVS